MPFPPTDLAVYLDGLRHTLPLAALAAALIRSTRSTRGVQLKTELESGATVEYTPVQDLKGKHRRLLDRVTRPQLPPGAIDAGGQVDMDMVLGAINVTSLARVRHDALWAALITAWSYELPVPEIDGDQIVNAESLDELPLDDYEEIEQLLAPHAAKLGRKPNPKAAGAATTSSSSGLSRANGVHPSLTD